MPSHPDRVRANYVGSREHTECMDRGSSNGKHVWCRQRDGRECAYCGKREYRDFSAPQEGLDKSPSE